MKIDKQKIKEQAKKVGLDAVAILVCGIAAKALPEFVPAFQDFEIFVAVASGIWLYMPLRKLIEKVK